MTDAPRIPREAARRRLPRLLVRLRGAWRSVCEVCAFLRAAARAVLDFVSGRWV